ncbi:peptidylprolyl isomerase [Sphingopyxis sp.]|uniref:peptidylprolyl isomerase n=1 Tax=Sphingopyxis sp. TaxID=1908224 RepID=UPI003BAC4084
MIFETLILTFAMATAAAPASSPIPAPPPRPKMMAPPPPPPPLPPPLPGPPRADAPDTRPYVALVTNAGTITVRLEDKRAPGTAANFLRYVDTKRMDGFKFYRSTKSWGGASALVQGGNRGDARRNFPPIAHEPTNVTGLTACKGAILMARGAPGDATSDFFLLLADVPGFNADPSASGDNAGFAVFGELVGGADVVQKLYDAPTSPTAGHGVMVGQMLEPQFTIVSARRVPAPVGAPKGCVVKAAP